MLFWKCHLFGKKHAIIHVIMKVTHIVKEIHSLVLMDVTLVHALLERSLVQKIHVQKFLPLATTKAAHTMKEIHSLVLMDVIIVLALLEMSLVQLIHAKHPLLVELILIVLLDFIVPKNHVMIHKVLAVLCPRVASISSSIQFVVATTNLTFAHV